MGIIKFKDDLTDEVMSICMKNNGIADDFTWDFPGPFDISQTIYRLIGDAWEQGLFHTVMTTEVGAWDLGGEFVIHIQARGGLRLCTEQLDPTEWAEKRSIDIDALGTDLAREILNGVRQEVNDLLSKLVEDRNRTVL